MWLIVIVLVYLAWKSVHERRWAWVWGSLCAMKLKPFLKIIKWCWTFLVIIFNDLDCEYVNVLRYLGNTVQSHSCVSIISFFYVSTDVLTACYGKQVMSEKSTNTIESHVEKKCKGKEQRDEKKCMNRQKRSWPAKRERKGQKIHVFFRCSEKTKAVEVHSDFEQSERKMYGFKWC